MKPTDKTKIFDFLKEQKNNSAKSSPRSFLNMLVYFSDLTPNYSVKNPLSVQEVTCLILLSLGLKPEQCSELMGIATKTLMTYEQRIRKKLGASNRTNAFYLAQKKEFIKYRH
jgi:DNA-binding NarL/FixJ family response regulator